MKRVIAFCVLLLALVLGYLHIDSRPAWAPFVYERLVDSSAADDPPETSEAIKPKTTKGLSPVSTVPIRVNQDWLPDTGAPSVHAASLIALRDGAVRAFWFAGSREGASDVAIYSSVYDPAATRWSAPTEVLDRVSAEKGLSRYIAKLGNPVPARMADGRLQLFVVTVSIGGWAGSSISTMVSGDEGLTWSRPQRLITSPLMNLSTLVKSPPVPFADGRFGLPVYHEWIGRFGEFLRVDAQQVIDKRRMNSGREAIQPVLFVNGPQEASAFFRQTRSASKPKQIPVSLTNDAGQSWTVSQDLAIPNPNSAIASLILANGDRVMVVNDIAAARYRLVMMMRAPGESEWRVVQVIEDDDALTNGLHREFSYPYLITGNGFDIHLTYTWDRKKIRHLYYPAAWVKQAQASLVEAP